MGRERRSWRHSAAVSRNTGPAPGPASTWTSPQLTRSRSSTSRVAAATAFRRQDGFMPGSSPISSHAKPLLVVNFNICLAVVYPRANLLGHNKTNDKICTLYYLSQYAGIYLGVHTDNYVNFPLTKIL